MNAIEIKNLIVKIRDKLILEIDELNIKENSLFILVGPNGAGKTTLLRVISGFIRPQGGCVKVLGNDLTSSNSPLIINELRRNTGYLPQIPPESRRIPITVEQIISIGRLGIRKMGRLKKEDRDIIDKWIKELGLEQIRSSLYCELSGGQQRKVLICQAMVRSPKLLILDEPLGQLDIYWQKKLLETIEYLRKKDSITVILTSHQLNIIPESTDTIAVMVNGRIIAKDKPNNIDAERTIEAYYNRQTQEQAINIKCNAKIS